MTIVLEGGVLRIYTPVRRAMTDDAVLLRTLAAQWEERAAGLGLRRALAPLRVRVRRRAPGACIDRTTHRLIEMSGPVQICA